MKKLALTALAASVAFIPNAASAQHRPPPGAHVAGPPGHVMSHRGPDVAVRHDGGRFRHPGRNFPHRRLRHGVAIHPFWFGPQFHIANWQMYGFAHPAPDHRWIRYYDDAYMIDRSGRVRDARYGMDWDRYGERWADDDGIPAYYGRGDYRPDDEDYAWVEEQDRRAYADRGYDDHHGGGWDYSEYGRGTGHGYPPPGCHPAPQPCGGYGGGGGHGYPPPMPSCRPARQPCGGYGYQQSYGYGYGYGWPAMIVETTVTTAGSVTYTEEVVEEVVRTRRAHRPRRAPVRRPPPPPGERG